ncbi:MAG: hypothetical protein JWQ06_623 [Mucilaginibacter sp.]|nr:hypothetical protein [Mucilaginibacter sp.]
MLLLAMLINNKRALFIFILILSVVLLRKFNSFETNAPIYKHSNKCELKSSNNHNKSRLFNSESSSTQVINNRIIRSFHFIKCILIILGGLFVCYPCLKYDFHISNKAYAWHTKLILFPHHVFW